MNTETRPAYTDPAGLLRQLIRFNTENPPGNEEECILYIRQLLTAAGLECTIVTRQTGRPNLAARLKGSGKAPPLLLYGHADVVGAGKQVWQHPPFDGVLDNGFVWGRGALDMKGALAMMLCALLRTRAEGFVPAGDILFAVFSDEEELSENGARFVVEEHSRLFAGVRYAIGEIGGFTFHLNGKCLYPVMVAEKQKCCLKITARGPGGHGSMPVRGAAMAKLAFILARLDKHRLPVHITPVAKEMIGTIARALPFPANILLHGLQHPMTADFMLDVLGVKGALFDPVLHNTVNATIIRTSGKINLVPDEIVVELDARLLPGFKVDVIICELQKLLGKEFLPEITFYAPGPEKADMGLYPLLADLLRAADNRAVPVPFMISGCTDSRHLSRLGIQTYGFTPLLLPAGMEFTRLFHGADERVPVSSLEWGANVLYALLQQYGKRD